MNLFILKETKESEYMGSKDVFVSTAISNDIRKIEEYIKKENAKDRMFESVYFEIFEVEMHDIGEELKWVD